MTVAETRVSALEYRPALDGLRAYAVLSVVLFHAGATSSLPGLAPGGFLGVSVFFTLSGYLVTTLLIRRSSSPEGLDLGTFWARRIRRLAPVSIAVVLLTVLLASQFWPGMQAGDAAAGLFGYSNWNVIAQGEDELLRTIVGPLGPYWSLAVEEQFYVLLTVAVVLAWRTSRPIRTLSIVVAVGWLISLAVQVFTTGPQFRLEFGTDSRGSELLAGCGLALLLHVRPELIARHARRLAVAGPLVAIGLVGLVATTDYDPPWLLRGGYSAISIASAVLVASLLTSGPLVSMLSTTWTVIIGRLSYSWYVVHWPVILILTENRTGMSGWTLVGLKVAVSCAAASVLHLSIEQPIRRLASPVAVTATAAVGTGLTVFVLALAIL